MNKLYCHVVVCNFDNFSIIFTLMSSQKLKNILVIEDEAIIATDIKDILEALGYRVMHIIKNGDEAISYLSFHNPDLVLCDINIQGSKDGVEVATLIQKKKKVPFVFLSSYSDARTLDRAKHALPYGYVVKPFTSKDIASAIEIALFKFEQEIKRLQISQEILSEMANERITDKEFDIIKHMILGQDYKAIAEAQSISMNTIKYHTKNIFRKFNVNNKASLMQLLLAKYLNV